MDAKTQRRRGGRAGGRSRVATVTLTRPSLGNKVVGSAQARVSGGDVAFEVNHPGGVCWGAGTSLKVTPDILPGDVASIAFGGTTVGDTRVQDGFVAQDAILSGSTVTVKGHIGPDVIKDNTEQRIVEPDLVTTTVARRDVRAVPGPMTRAPKGGYSSALEFGAGDTFTATYLFDDPAVAEIAANASRGGGLLSGEAPAAANIRQGVTIAEFGEAGGPGFGGCPNGPLQSGPPGPSDVSAVSLSGGASVKLTWTPATPAPGTPAVLGYRARAVAQTVNAAGEQVEIGKRVPATATGTTITGLSTGETYDVEVVAVSSVGETFPPVHAIPASDTVAPIVQATPPGGSYTTARNVVLSASEAGSDIYYTTNGAEPVSSDVLNAGATLYKGAIPVTVDTTLKFAAFDPAGNVSATRSEKYTITNTPTPDAPKISSSSVGVGSVTLNLDAADPSITSFTVQAFNAAGAAIEGGRETTAAETAARSVTLTGLTSDLDYYFTVTATNANGTSDASVKVGPLTPTGTVVANAGPDQRITRRPTATTVSLSAAGSTAGATLRWEQLKGTGAMPATDADFVQLAGADSASPTFSLRVFKHPMTNTPLVFRLTVTSGGVSKTDTVVVTPVPDQVAIGTAKWKPGDFRVTGTSSAAGGTITVHKGTLDGVTMGQAPVTAAVAPATGGVFDARTKSTVAPFSTNPQTVWIESTLGGVAGPFSVSAG